MNVQLQFLKNFNIWFFATLFAVVIFIKVPSWIVGKDMFEMFPIYMSFGIVYVINLLIVGIDYLRDKKRKNGKRIIS